MTDAQKFHELTGRHWHKFADFRNPELVGTGRCTKCGSIESNPTYSNAADILNRMKEFCGGRKYESFLKTVYHDDEYTWHLSPLIVFIDEYILNPSALLRKAVEFLEAGK